METFWSTCTHPEMVVVTWLEWVEVSLVVMLSKSDPLGLMVCDPLIALISGYEGSVITRSKVAFTPMRLAQANLFFANFRREPSPGRGSSGELLR